MKIVTTTIEPLFAAEGRDGRNKTKVIIIFTSYEKAQNKAKELIHVGMKKVSAYRIEAYP